MISEFLMVAALATGLSSQDTTDTGQNKADERGRASRMQARRAEMRETIGLYFVHAAKRELGLSDEQALELLPLIEKLEEVRFDSGSARRELMQELRQLSEQDEPSSAAVENAIRALDQEETRARELERAVRAEMIELLNPRQQAKFVLFIQQFRRKLQRRLRGFESDSRGTKQRRPRRKRHDRGIDSDSY